MSVHNLTQPNNGIALYCDSLVTNTINTAENPVGQLSVFDNLGNYLGFVINMKMNNTGDLNLFYNNVTSATGSLTTPSYFQFGYQGSPNNYAVTGLPEIYGSTGTTYSSLIYMYLNGVNYPVQMRVGKLSSTTVSIQFYNYNSVASATLPTGSYSWGPFNISLPLA